MKKFEVFKQKGKKWQEFFGLTNWLIDYANEKEEDKECAGSTNASVRDRQAYINMSDKFEGTLDDVELTAFHEMCEVMLTPLRQMALGQYPANEHSVDEACHDIIQRLTNGILGQHQAECQSRERRKKIQASGERGKK